MKKIIFEEYNEDLVYNQLVRFKNGEIGPNEINDPLIKNVRKNGIVSIKFEYIRKFFELFHIDRNNLSLIDEIFSDYSHHELVDPYRCWQDWYDGYLIDSFNQENKKLLMNISSIVYPIDIGSSEQRIELSKYLQQVFKRHVEDIVNEFHSEIEEHVRKQTRQDIKHEYCDIFSNYGIYSNVCFYSYFTTVDNLIKLYDSSGNKSYSIERLFKSLAGDTYAADDIYELLNENTYGNMNLDDFQESVKNILENILWDLENDDDNFLNLEEYKEIVKKITSKFEFQKTYSVPKDKNISFTILYVDPKTNKVVFKFSSKNEFDKTGKLSIDGFFNFLYNLELF